MTKRGEFKRILEAHGIEPTVALLDELEAVGKRERAQVNGEHTALVTLFCELTGLWKPEPKTVKARLSAAELWWQPLRRIQDAANGESETCLRLAVERMRNQSLTIYSPKSVEKTAIAIFAERGGARSSASVAGDNPFAALLDYVERKEAGHG
jgi:hypothetical protein